MDLSFSDKRSDGFVKDTEKSENETIVLKKNTDLKLINKVLILVLCS